MLKAEDILRLSDKQRKRRKFGEGKRKCAKRQTFTKDELIQFLRDYNIRSARKLCRLTLEEGVRRPNISHYFREFGKWNDAKIAAFGRQIVPFSPRIDAEYTVRVVIEFGLWNYRKYLRARKARPDIIPSYRQIINKWGRFSKMIYVARAFSLKEELASYRELKKITGHWPTMAECERHGVNISGAKEFFGSKKKIQDFINDVERQRRKCEALKK